LEYFLENPALQLVLVVEEFPNDSRDLIHMATSWKTGATAFNHLAILEHRSAGFSHARV